MNTAKTVLVALVTLATSQVIGGPQQDVVGYWTFSLKPGFNLIAFPVLPNTPTLQTVVGSRLGDVEVTTWDGQLGRHRWAKFNSDEARWTGDLFLLNRGQAYWFNLLGNGERRLTVSGHPEIYTKWSWDQAGYGWGTYAPTIGKLESLEDLPPGGDGDFVLRWNRDEYRFESAAAGTDGRWHPERGFNQFAPDEAYITYITAIRRPRKTGPPPLWEAQLDRLERRNPLHTDDIGDENLPYDMPPWPLLVGNINGLAVCYQDGRVCGAGMKINIIRERTRLGPNGQIEPFAENMGEIDLTPDRAPQGRFVVPLTISSGEGHLNPGDRVYLMVEGPRGGITRSNSFEIPYQDLKIIDDIVFPNPLSSPGNIALAPTEFVVEPPFPNPFNDRFSFQVRVPNQAHLTYTVYDISGRQLFNWTRPVSAGVHRVSVQAQGWAAGIYLLEVKAGIETGRVKIAHIR